MAEHPEQRGVSWWGGGGTGPESLESSRTSCVRCYWGGGTTARELCMGPHPVPRASRAVGGGDVETLPVLGLSLGFLVQAHSSHSVEVCLPPLFRPGASKWKDTATWR